jgi:S1-C subfamily serine protease
MKLDANQRGILVAEVISGSPAEKTGLRPSQDVVMVDGTELPVGGDVITAIDNRETQTIEDLIAYLAVNTQVGQQATLTILRDGKVELLEVTLATRPN